MSIKMMTHVWERSDLATGEKFVLIALADFSNDDGDCWPSMEQIAKKCSMTDRNVQLCVRKLEARGFVVVTEPGGGRGRRRHYRVVPNPESEAEKPSDISMKNFQGNGERVKSVQEKGEKSDISPPHPPYKAEPSKNRQTPRESDLFHGTEDGAVDSQHRRSWKELFEEWWAIYPRKASRKKAEEKFRAALKQASFETLMQATRNYAAAMSAKGTEQQFIAHGSTWLNQERWNDWLSPEEEPSEAMRMLKNMGYA